MKGTASKGKKMRKGRLHLHCIRCGKTAFHKVQRYCGSCGYGRSKRMRHYQWMKKKRSKWAKKAFLHRSGK